MAKVHYLDHCNAAPLGQQVAMLNHNSQRGATLVALTVVGIEAPQNVIMANGRRQAPIPVAVGMFAIDEWQYKETFGEDYDPQKWENINLGAE